MNSRAAFLFLVALVSCGGTDPGLAEVRGNRVPFDQRLGPWLGSWSDQGVPSLSIVRQDNGEVMIVPAPNKEWSARVEGARFDGSVLQFDLFYDCETMDHPYSGVRNQVRLELGDEPDVLVSTQSVESVGLSSDAVLRRSQ